MAVSSYRPNKFLKGTPINEWATVTALGGSTTTIKSYTVPVGKKLFLDFVEFTGETIATFRVKIDGFIESQKDTYWSGPLFGEFVYNGFEVPASKIVLLEVVNFRTEDCDFAGRIIGRLDDA